MDCQITASRKDGLDLDRRLDGFTVNGKYETIDQVIAWIESGAHRFFVSVFGRNVLVIVAQRGLLGRKFLTTQADGFPPNNLLNLPDC